MNDPKDDPVGELAKGLAADHTLAKARGETGSEAAANDADEAAEPAETAEAPPARREPIVVGDFGGFDEVREFVADPAFGCGALVSGDLVVINGGLSRYRNGVFDTVISSLVDEFALPVDHTERFARDLVELERIVLSAEFESGPLLGNLRDTMLALFKARPKSWSEMSNLEQRDLAKQLEAQCRTLIGKVARVVAEGEEISVTGKLESFNCKGGFDLKISAPGDEDAVVQLFKMVGHEVVILSADSQRFVDGVPEARTDPDEPTLFADDEIDPGKVAETIETFAKTREIPDDDSDLAGDFEEDEDPDLATGSADDSSQLGEAVEEMLDKRVDPGVGDYETRENPDDAAPATGTGAAAIAAMNAAAKTESDAEISARLTGGFDEASEEELAAQDGRKPASDGEDEEELAADYTGPKQPDDMVPGESWLDTAAARRRVRWMHPNGRLYLSKPTEDALEAWRSAQASRSADAADDFPADPS